MAYALLFPGQASQQVGMGEDFRAAAPTAAVFEAADRATELPLSQVIAEGPLERLTDTRYAQPAVVATSLAALVALRTRLEEGRLPEPAFCAGHSVGELAALAAVGALDVAEVLRLVARRSQLMAAACERVDGTMAAVLGLDEASLVGLCREASEATGVQVQLANLNAPDQLVVSGHRQAVTWLQAEVPRRGGKRAIPLNVAGPFHSAYMRPAAEAFAAEVAAASVRPPKVPLVLNQSAKPTRDVDEIRRELSEQIAAPVRWSDSLRTMHEAGCRVFVEVGPGQVLAGLVRRTLPEARVVGVQDNAALENALAALIDERDSEVGR